MSREKDVIKAMETLDSVLDYLAATTPSQDAIDWAFERIVKARNYLDRSYGDHSDRYDTLERQREIDFRHNYLLEDEDDDEDNRYEV